MYNSYRILKQNLLFKFQVHCEWDEWTIGECDLPCGGGFRTNTRTAKVEANHGGDDCAGTTTIIESCNVHECPGNCISTLFASKDL